MEISRFIKTKITERGINQTKLAELAGFKSQSNISMLLKSKNITVNNLMALLDALDCELIMRDKITGGEQAVTVNSDSI